MKVIEFQIPLPLTLDMYQLCCVYLVTKASLQEVENGGGFEISKNELCERDGVLGRIMEKRFYFGKNLPLWLQSLLGKELTIVSEQSWTVFPYTMTKYSNKKLTSFEFSFESITHDGVEPRDNALNLSDKDLSRRKVVVLDVTEFKKCKLYDAQYDVTAKRSQHTDALPMKPGWWKQPGCKGVIAYKLLKVDIPYFGFLASRVENYLVNYLQDKLMLYICTAMCSIDEWYNADIEDLRIKEQECYELLNQKFREQYGHLFRDSQELPARDTPKASRAPSSEEKRPETKPSPVVETATKPREVEKSPLEAAAAPAKAVAVARPQAPKPSSHKSKTVAVAAKETADSTGYRSVLSAAFSDMRKDTKDGVVGGAYVSRAARVVATRSFRSVSGEEEFWDCLEELDDAHTTLGSVPSRRPSLSAAHTSSSAIPAVCPLKREDECLPSPQGPTAIVSRKCASLEEHGYRHVHENRASQFPITTGDVLPIPVDYPSIREYRIPGSSIEAEESEPVDTERGDHSSSSLGDVDETVAPLAAAAERYTPSMFTGYLYKLGGTFFYQWNIRYIMICDGNMHYYDSRDDTRPKATISLMDARINWVGHYMGRPNVFSVTTRTKRTYYWSAEEESTVKRWILLLQVLSESSPEALMDDLATEYLYRVEKSESVGGCSPPSAGSYMDVM
ncbi:phosphatidylinositol transfer protein [Babesia ovata]|uniref:Phosphatidylinositol transfer protein n=1 Tax=Babesia ovata TaxID=189622 RepID=A0A2H6KGX1_9APIC|nr:phosphatidylinositol transfer protein [Babesia ovata]GBE62231.1 phosphatidylinositol transfer protein [Babesia ovata]